LLIAVAHSLVVAHMSRVIAGTAHSLGYLPLQKKELKCC